MIIILRIFLTVIQVCKNSSLATVRLTIWRFKLSVTARRTIRIIKRPFQIHSSRTFLALIDKKKYFKFFVMIKIKKDIKIGITLYNDCIYIVYICIWEYCFIIRMNNWHKVRIVTLASFAIDYFEKKIIERLTLNKYCAFVLEIYIIDTDIIL